MAAIIGTECPLWVKSGHRGQLKECPLNGIERSLSFRIIRPEIPGPIPYEPTDALFAAPAFPVGRFEDAPARPARGTALTGTGDRSLIPRVFALNDTQLQIVMTAACRWRSAAYSSSASPPGYGCADRASPTPISAPRYTQP